MAIWLRASAIATLATAVLAASVCKPPPPPPAQIAVSQVRLAFAGAHDMAVSFQTPGQVTNPTIKFGLSKDRLDNVAHGVSQTYPTSTNWSNHIKLATLEADATYYYQIEGDSQVRTFKTSPVVGEQPEWSFALIADMGAMGPLGLQSTTQNTIQSLAQEQDSYEFIWHDGDLAYADSWLSEELGGYLPLDIAQGTEQYEAILETYYNETSVLTSVKPYMVAVGNHEANCDEGGSGNFTSSICVPGQSNFTGYISHWRMPSEESGGVSNMWYSFDYGNVHFVTYSTETDLGNGIQGPDEPGGSQHTNAGPFGSYPNEQIDWLINDLKNVDRKKTPWVLASGHRPWYAAQDPSGNCVDCQHAFEQTLYEYGVDVLFFGHVHNYERIAPVYKGVVDPAGLNNPKAPWYFINGIAGHYNGLSTLELDDAPPGYTYGQDTDYGWSRLIIHNSTHLTHEFVASANNTVLDSATLYKEHKY